MNKEIEIATLKYCKVVIGIIKKNGGTDHQINKVLNQSKYAIQNMMDLDNLLFSIYERRINK